MHEPGRDFRQTKAKQSGDQTANLQAHHTCCGNKILQEQTCTKSLPGFLRQSRPTCSRGSGASSSPGSCAWTRQPASTNPAFQLHVAGRLKGAPCPGGSPSLRHCPRPAPISQELTPKGGGLQAQVPPRRPPPSVPAWHHLSHPSLTISLPVPLGAFGRITPLSATLNYPSR